MKESGGDYRPDWFVIASHLAADDAERQGLLDALAEFAERLPAAAATVMSEVSDKNTAAHALTRLEGMVSDAVSAAVGQVEARVHQDSFN
jgi:hypothetical protein